MRILRFGAVLMLGLAVLVALGQPAWAQGLQLDVTEDKVVEVGEAPNPHNELDCTDCHLEQPAEAPGQGDRSKVVFIDNLAEQDLCVQCHDPEDHLHPAMSDPAAADPPVKIPDLFPVGTKGEGAGKVICPTCHFLHSDFAGYKMIRGFPEKPGGKGQFTDRRQMCLACHGENLAKKTPHKGKDETAGGCSFCHSTLPKEGAEVTFRYGITDLCNFCHAATSGAHYLKVNPFADPGLQAEIPNLKLPGIDKGEYSCATCHNSHGGTTEPHYLFDEYVEFANKSRRIRPHFQDTFCRTCHKVKPKEGDKLADVPLLLEDPTALCDRCHASGLAVSDIHPLPEVPADWDGGKIPAEFPLYNGRLSCLTCHTPGDRAEFDPQNPSFIRLLGGKYYESRNDPCWACHDQDAFAELDPHLDIQSGEGCEFCHQKKPDMSKSIDLQQMDFKGDINLLCLRCHDAFPHPANADHTGVPDEKWKDKIPYDEFPLDAQGRLTCASCHNPHVSGEGKTRGMSVGLEICPSCHVR